MLYWERRCRHTNEEWSDLHLVAARRCGGRCRRRRLAQPAPDAPPDAAFRSMLPRLARYRAAWGDANVPCALIPNSHLPFFPTFPARQYENARMGLPGWHWPG